MTASPPPTALDPRARAFCAPEGPEVFHAIAHQNEIGRPDPYDVESIHDEAREAFRRLVARASAVPRPAAGRILLLMGESGAGKTHLMRAFRNWAHGGERGYCGYMQMTTATGDYGRYILNNLIDSLSRPYDPDRGETTGLKRLSTALAESSRHVPVDRLAQLRDPDLDTPCLGPIVDALADQIVMDERFNDCDLDLVRALLFFQRDDPGLRSRVIKYLRCEDLSPADREALHGLTPRTYPEAAARVVGLLGRLMGSVESVPLILCVDQLEDFWNFDEAPLKFRRAMAALIDLADRVPSCVVVISCLEDFYKAFQAHLATPARARIEQDPKPILLSARRDLGEVSELIARRLAALYEAAGAEVDPADPTYPFPAARLADYTDLPTRLILDACRDYRDRCLAAGTIVALDGETKVLPAPVTPPLVGEIVWEGLWNEARTGSVGPIPGTDAGLATLLAESLAACSDECGVGREVEAEANEGMIDATRGRGTAAAAERLVIGICNRSAQGGGLASQVDAVVARAAGAGPNTKAVLVRSTEYPANPTTVIARKIGNVVVGGGRRVVVEDADWRAMVAMRAFRDRHRSEPGFAAWLGVERPLSRLDAIRRVLALDDDGPGPDPRPEPVVGPVLDPQRPAPDAPAASGGDAAPVARGPIELGTTIGLRPVPAAIEPAELAMHAAFLGGSGSGKTTLALVILEDLLIRGIPAILVDRKGDLARYADPDAWTGPLPEGLGPEAEARRAALRDRIEVALYTPGSAEGRPLSIAAVPPGLGRLPSAERAKTALYAAAALGGMMNYKPSGADQPRVVILARAMDLLSQASPDAPPTLDGLAAFIESADPALVNDIGRLDTRHFAKLVEGLETLRHARGDLFASRGEAADAEALFGLGPHATPGKTRLSIVSTRFLDNTQDIQFWVAQFLVELARWTGRSPSKRLQAVVLFDEADLYLPAVGKPATKEPMENLLKRARSAGLGLMLATQSPGDFDYRCRENLRNWFVGRVRETTALAKMKPMFEDCRGDVASRLPGQSAGQFHLLRDGEAIAFAARRSLIATEQLPEGRIATLARLSLTRR